MCVVCIHLWMHSSGYLLTKQIFVCVCVCAGGGGVLDLCSHSWIPGWRLLYTKFNRQCSYQRKDQYPSTATHTHISSGWSLCFEREEVAWNCFPHWQLLQAVLSLTWVWSGWEVGGAGVAGWLWRCPRRSGRAGALKGRPDTDTLW